MSETGQDVVENNENAVVAPDAGAEEVYIELNE